MSLLDHPVVNWKVGNGETKPAKQKINPYSSAVTCSHQKNQKTQVGDHIIIDTAWGMFKADPYGLKFARAVFHQQLLSLGAATSGAIYEVRLIEHMVRI